MVGRAVEESRMEQPVGENASTQPLTAKHKRHLFNYLTKDYTLTSQVIEQQ